MGTPELIELARSLPLDAFVAKVSGRFLVLGVSDDQQPLTFSTQVFRAPPKASGRDELTVLPVVKAANNPYPDRVSVGRARNCDVVVRDPSVSKLHAVIRIDGESFSLVDVGSQNGTHLNGQRLLANEAVAIACNDEIILGTVNTIFMDGAGVHTLLVATTGQRAGSHAT